MKRTLTKKQRLFRNLLILVLLVGLMDFLISDAFLFPELQFRKEERGHLVGPSTILGKEEIDHDYCDSMIIGKTQEGVILWLYGEDIGRTYFIYRKNYDDNMIVTGSGSLGSIITADEVHLPIVLFDSVPKASRAEISFTLSEVYNDVYYEKTYQLEAQRSAQGYFLFTLHAEAENTWEGLGAEGAMLRIFANISANLFSYIQYAIPVEIRFYDITGTLIETDTVTLRSEAAIYLEESGVIP